MRGIGRKLFGSSLFPFLKIGVTLVNFHSVGNKPVPIDFIIICVSDGATMLAAIFKNLFGVLSRPIAFLSLSFSNSLRTTFTAVAFIEKVVSVGSI